MVARVDMVTDAGILGDILLARRGQAYFSRKLMELRDGQLRMPSAIPGWSCAHVVADVGLHARVLAELVGKLTARGGGDESLDIRSLAQWRQAVDFSATLPARAVRNLSDHAAVHLSVEWRDLPDPTWSQTLTDFTGEHFTVATTPWRRSLRVWIRAIDLGNGGRWDHLPHDLTRRVLADVAVAWSQTDGGRLVLEPRDDDQVLDAVGGGPGETVLRGSTAALTRWALGRGAHGLDSGTSHVPAAPAPALV